MTAEDKKPYEDQAAADKKRYEAAKATYDANPKKNEDDEQDCIPYSVFLMSSTYD